MFRSTSAIQNAKQQLVSYRTHKVSALVASNNIGTFTHTFGKKTIALKSPSPMRCILIYPTRHIQLSYVIIEKGRYEILYLLFYSKKSPVSKITRTDIEELLLRSLKEGLAVSITVKNKPPLYTAISDLKNNGRMKMVVMMPETLYGYQIEETVILLDEIEDAHSLNVYYDDPLYVRLRAIKKIFGNRQSEKK